MNSPESLPENTFSVFALSPLAFSAAVTSLALTADAFLPFLSVTLEAMDAGSGSDLPPHTSERYVRNKATPAMIRAASTATSMMMSLFGPGLVAAVVVAVAGAVCVAVATVAVGCVAAGAETTAGADMPAAPCGIGIGGTAAPPGPGTEAAAGAGVAPAGVGATGASCGVMEALDAAVFASVAVSGVPHVSQNLLPSALSVWQLGQSINGISYESTRLRSRTIMV